MLAEVLVLGEYMVSSFEQGSQNLTAAFNKIFTVGFGVLSWQIVSVFPITTSSVIVNVSVQQ
jgi:hypothetical protein